MLNFKLSGSRTKEQEKETTEYVSGYLGDMKDEFESKNGVVTIDFDKPVGDAGRIRYSIPNEDVSMFVDRLQVYRKENKYEG